MSRSGGTLYVLVVKSPILYNVHTTFQQVLLLTRLLVPPFSTLFGSAALSSCFSRCFLCFSVATANRSDSVRGQP